MELRQLRYFVRIVDMGSLSRASGVLHVAQSALSQQVAALEAELGQALLTRNTRGVAATEAGHALYRHAQAMLKQADDARAEVAQAGAAPSGRVEIGIPLSLVAPLALPVFEAVRAQYPRIQLLIHEELSGTILEWVKNGRLGMGLVFDDGQLEGTQATPLIEERLFLVLHPKSPLARRKLLALKELAALDLVMPSPGHGVRDRIERTLARAGLPPPRVVAEMNSLAMMKQAVEARLGATILSWPSVEAEVLAQRLAAVEIARPAITRVAVLCLPAGAPRSRAVDCVLATARETIAQVVRRAPWRGVRCVDSA
ncbi:LysR substrate-binding domain-containing protein [Aquabacterium sp.]|uniref:LysR substrate-binding domain-containing protein n=1 Tax=Aquabacterium sp. TaxID=1872578 RepID=UPI003784223F